MLSLSVAMQGACEVVTSGAAVTAGFVGLYVADFSLNFQSIKCVAPFPCTALAMLHEARPCLSYPPAALTLLVDGRTVLAS